MSKETRKNIPEEKKEQRNQYDTSAENILKDKPDGRHFNEDVVPRRQKLESDPEQAPNAHLGAEDIPPEEAKEPEFVDSNAGQNEDAEAIRKTTSITAPEIREERTEEEEETLDEIKRDMTGG
jgi:hypothetical protein